MTWFRPAPHPPFYAAVEHGRPRRTLEISSRSSDRLGRDLSAMNLPADDDPHGRSVEAVYQAAKCYGDGGPDTCLSRSGYEAKHHDRERRRQARWRDSGTRAGSGRRRPGPPSTTGCGPAARCAIAGTASWSACSGTTGSRTSSTGRGPSPARPRLPRSSPEWASRGRGPRSRRPKRG